MAQIKSPKPGYELVWNDEFNGTEVDWTKWSHRGLGKRAHSYVVESAISMDGKGNLLITGSKQGDRYHSGMIGTQNTRLVKYGYFECRAKLLQSVGVSAAFWLQSPVYGTNIGNPAAGGAEIDIMEYRWLKKNKVTHSVHWDGYKEHYKRKSHTYKNNQLKKGGWHTFALEWTENEYIFYVDGKESFRTKEGISNIPQYMILSMEVNDWSGDLSKSTLPVSVAFDYVRVFQKKGYVPKKELRTEFFEAVIEGKMEKVKQMLLEGFDLKTVNNYGRTALHEAAAFGKNKITKLLIEKGADVNAKDKKGLTPLHMAANSYGPLMDNNLESIKILIANGANVLAKNNEGLNPLEYGIHSEHAEALELLIDKGCPVNKTYKNGATLLHQTAWGGRITATKLLIEKGADVFAKNKKGQTPLDVASYPDVVNMLKEVMKKK